MSTDRDVVVEALSGDEIERALPALARLRITVFRAYPYLYDGTLDYEQKYLARFARAEGAVIVAARDGEDIVGVATGSPLGGHTADFVPLFAKHGLDPDEIFYFGESVLLPSHRGRGIGHRFFDLREQHARTVEGPNGRFVHTAFCGVVRPHDHPQRPADHRALDPFWSKRGYRKIEGMLGSYAWKDVDEVQETAKPMQFWIKAL
jgi:GNAT superfamily N-acetyltransferase